MTASPSSEALRAQLLKDPYTVKLAEELGVPLDEYVQQVLHFMQHPGEELQILDEDVARFLDEAAPGASASEQSQESSELQAELDSLVRQGRLSGGY